MSETWTGSGRPAIDRVKVLQRKTHAQAAWTVVFCALDWMLVSEPDM